MNAGRERITSRQNPRVKALVKLHQRRERENRGLTLIEEPLVIRRALAAGHPLAEIWYCPELLISEEARRLLADLVAAGLSTTEADDHVIDRITYRERSEGLVAIARHKHVGLAELELSPSPLVVVLEALEKPGNLGAILRTADGAGADAVLVCEERTDLYNPNVLRASRGAVFTVPTVAAEAGAIRAFLRERGLTIVATSPRADRPYFAADFTGPTALVFGSEHEGLGSEWLLVADVAVGLPMRGDVDSLNVSTTAAILLYEVLRQRDGND